MVRGSPGVPFVCARSIVTISISYTIIVYNIHPIQTNLWYNVIINPINSLLPNTFNDTFCLHRFTMLQFYTLDDAYI